MYKIMIKIATRDGYQWSFYQEDGEDYSGTTIAEIREKALELLDEYGEDNVKIVDEMCGDDLDNVISYVFGSEGGTTDYNDLENKPTINNVELKNNKTLSDLGIINFSGNYNDLTNKPTIPDSTSDLTNDSGFITNAVSDLTNYTKTADLASVATSGSYNDLTNKPTIPTKTSDLENDSEFISQDEVINDVTSEETKLPLSANMGKTLQDEINNLASALDDKQNVISDLDAIRSGAALGATAVQPETGKGLFSGDYNDLINKPTIPTKTSDLTNDSGFIDNTYHDSTKQDVITTSTDLSINELTTADNLTVNGDETNINGKLFVKYGAVEMTGGTVTMGDANISYVQAESLNYRENGITEPAEYVNVKTVLDGKQNALTTITGYDATKTQILKNINGILA